MTLDDLKPGLRHSRTFTVTEAVAVPTQAQIFDPATEMPPVFATAQMIALVEWTCVAALAPYLAPHQRTLGTHVTAEVELVAFDGRKLRFKAVCRDEADVIGEGFHERVVVDHDRFLA